MLQKKDRKTDYKRSLITTQSKNLGAYLRKFRTRQKLSQAGAAALLQTTQTELSKYENGIRIPTRQTLRRYLDSGLMNWAEYDRAKERQAEALKNGTPSQRGRVKQLQSK